MMFGILLVVAVFGALVTSDDDVQKTYNIYETAEHIIADGFPSETHHVTTSDGYILEMHRIPNGRSVADTEDKAVVFLMHGFLSASNVFIGLGPEYSLAYNLADAGFDVWMGNARGNKNSRYHVTLDPDDEVEKFPFFDFSFEEIGIYDLPAMIDYILEYTRKDNLHYIGHSQGGTVFLVLTSMLPEYNRKISSAHTLGGVGYQEYFPDAELLRTAAMTDIIYGTALQMGVVELFPPNSTEMVPEGLLPDGLFPYRTSDYCAGDIRMRHTCQLLGLQYILRDDSSFAEDFIPAGAALKQMAHYGQNIRDRLFRRFHYGTDENPGIYGTIQPPDYDLSLITTLVTMHYSLNDTLLDERDVLAMVADMPNAVARQVARASFLHEDYVGAYDAKELVTDFIIEAIRNEGQENHYTENDGVIVVESLPTNSSSTAVTNTQSAADNTTTPATPATEAITPATDSATASSAMLTVYLVVISFFVMLK